MTEKKEAETVATYGYQKGPDGTVVAKIFQVEADGKLPNGWHDSPAKLK